MWIAECQKCVETDVGTHYRHAKSYPEKLLKPDRLLSRDRSLHVEATKSSLDCAFVDDGHWQGPRHRQQRRQQHAILLVS